MVNADRRHTKRIAVSFGDIILQSFQTNGKETVALLEFIANAQHMMYVKKVKQIKNLINSCENR